MDVAVYLAEPARPTSPFGYAADLAATLMRALATNRVDVVILNDATPLLYHRVLRDGIRILSRDLRATTTREGQGDLDAQRTVERGLQLCAQNALDVATHLAASAGRDTPDHGSAIDALAELGVLPAEFAMRFRGIAGFRNVVVHGYLALDATRVHELLNAGLDDFAEFARRVEAYLDGRGR